MIEVENGKPALDFDGSNDFLDSALTVSTTDISITSVQKFDNVSGGQLSITISEGSGQQLYFLYNNLNTFWNVYYLGTSSALTADTNQNLVAFFTDGSATYYYKNGSTLGPAFTEGAISSNDPVRIGAWSGGSLNTAMKCQEFIIWQNDKSGSRTGIETNINTEFSIY